MATEEKVSRSIAGLFPDHQTALRARRQFRDLGYQPERLLLLAAVDGEHPPLRQRPECIFRWAVRWGIAGALVVEIPVLVALVFAPIDLGFRIFLAASVWKVGGLFGAWFGLLLGQDHGLEPEVAQRYERHLAQGRAVLAVRTPRRGMPGARGMLLESGALEARDLDGTFELKAPWRSVAPVS